MRCRKGGLHMQKTALITGASGGIGYELAKLFAKDRYDLVLIARNEEKLRSIKKDFEQVYDINVIVISKDLSNTTAPEEIFSELERLNIEIEVLVNNAGVVSFGAFHQVAWEKHVQMLQIYTVTLTQMTKLFLDKAVARGSGKIMNVTSLAAFEPGPLMSVYSASKAYITSFTEAIAYELKGTGITVTNLCPNITKTGILGNSTILDSKLYNLFVHDPVKVAAYGYAALQKGRETAIPGILSKLIVFMLRFVPRKFISFYLRKVLTWVK